jgi:uncharacterized repeat protein (TIGR01451 family)
VRDIRRRTLLITLLGVVLAMIAPAAAQAAFPGANGKIAFVRAGDIWTMNPDGTGQVNLTNSPEDEGWPAWSADANRIAFIRDRDVWTMLADGSGQTDLNVVGCCSPYSPSWSPDGQKIAFAIDAHCQDPGGIYVANSDGTDVTLIACVGPFIDSGYSHTAWSPDGETVAFAGSSVDLDIYRVAATGGLPTNLTNSENNIDFNPNWSPDGTKIAWDRNPFESDAIWTMNPDGTGQDELRPTGEDPAYSPDGSKIAFVDLVSAVETIHVMSSDGSGAIPITAGTQPDWQPLNQPGPEADVLALITDSPDPTPVGGILTYDVSAKNLVGPDDASGVTLSVNLPTGAFFISATPEQGSCSQASGTVTCNIGNLPQGSSVDVQIQVEPRNQGTNTATATVTATETDPIPGNNASQTTTTVTPGGYPRPKSAEPLRASLVPAYRACNPDEAGLVHGPPLAHPSCGSPAQTSGYLTVGTPDANGAAANSAGWVRLHEIGETPPIDPNNGDQADIGLQLNLTDVREKSTLSAYGGEVRAEMALRLTDQHNSPSGAASATVTDTTLSFDASCVGMAGPINIGSTCAISTTAEALIPGMVTERRRAIWELGRVRVFDGGADGDTATGPNTLFAVQGVFVP